MRFLKKLTFSRVLILFLLDIVLFAVIYLKINSCFEKSDDIPIRAFAAGEPLRIRAETEAKNDLRLAEFEGLPGQNTYSKWLGFINFVGMSAQPPQWFKDRLLRGTTPTEMVEVVFQKHWTRQYKISQYQDNNFNYFFPRLVLSEVTNIPIIRFNEPVNVSLEQKQLYAGLEKIAPQIRAEIFENREQFGLGRLRSTLMDFAKTCEQYSANKKLFRDAFYRNILIIIASPTTRMEIFPESLPPKLSYYDFIYFSLVLGTCNIPSEILPVVFIARFVMAFQLLVSYVLLGLLVATLAKALKL